MLVLDRKKLDGVARPLGFTLNRLAGACGISRQSVYNMFKGKYVLSTPLEKILKTLKVDLSDVTTSVGEARSILQTAPGGIREACSTLEDYAVDEGADLFLIGSRARGRKGVRSDWDFAIYFPDGMHRPKLAGIKFKASDAAFPHRLDVVCLNFAPAWFLASIMESAVRISGTSDLSEVFETSRRVERGRG